MKELIAIKVPSALISTILVIYLSEIHFTNQQIGIINAIASLASMLGSFYFSYRAAVEKRIENVLLSSILALFISTLSLVYLPTFKDIMLSIFLLNFYYNGYLYTLKISYSKEKRDIKEIQSKFEFLGGLFYLSGLLLGIFLSKFWSASNLIIFSGIWFLLGFIFIKGIKKTFLEVLESLSEETSKYVIESLNLAKLFKISKKTIPLHLFTFLVFLSIAIRSSQFQLFLKDILLLNNSLIFLSYFLNSLMTAIGYKIARMVKEKYLVFISFLYVFPPVLYLLGKLTWVILGIILDGLAYGLFIVLLDSLIISEHRMEFGTSTLFRNLGWIIGSYICGIILPKVGFNSLFLGCAFAHGIICLLAALLRIS